MQLQTNIRNYFTKDTIHMHLYYFLGKICWNVYFFRREFNLWFFANVINEVDRYKQVKNDVSIYENIIGVSI